MIAEATGLISQLTPDDRTRAIDVVGQIELLGPTNVLAELSGSLGNTTNNIAEYNGLIAALKWAVDHDVHQITIKGDSLLIIEQMRGNYKVKNEGLKPLYLQAKMLVMQVGNVKFEHVPREFNTDADRLSNVGMDGNS